jgi:enolase
MTGAAGHAHPTASATVCVGKDVFVTDPAILRRGIDAGIADSILIKSTSSER